jgi:hypothetical protein
MSITATRRIMQTGYFDDSGSDAGSQWYVLSGFIASTEIWNAISIKWRAALNKDPCLRYFKMREAMNMEGQFKRGWTIPLRNQRIFELVEIIEEFDPPRIECFLRRSHFDGFVKGIIGGQAFNDPYFVCFYHLILSIAANARALDWTRDCEFVFDDQGKLGTNAVKRWNWMKQNIDGANAANVNAYLGSPPVFRDDIKYPPLQAADMLAWLVRDCLTREPSGMEDIAKTALHHIEGRNILRIHIDKELLMRLGASFIIGKARLDGYF